MSKEMDGENGNVSPQPMLPNHQRRQSSTSQDRVSVWNWVSVLFFTVILSNSIFCTLLLCYDIFTHQETRSSIQSLTIKLDVLLQSEIHQDKNWRPIAQDTDSFASFRRREIEPEAENFGRLRVPETTQMPFAHCPTCPPCHPEEALPINKDPVSLVNLVYNVGATYECKTVCIDPPINIATLSIVSHNRNWEARNRKTSKQEAAYKALLELNATLAAQSGFEPEYYSPSCNNIGPAVSLVGPWDKMKC